ncbi:MAG TPA: tetratricopeptide repeat protein [Verrucomicrobiota bacterium]|nr:tetratricopeptide repeat protein [Verrucomicrobiota bacterium]HNT16112.1 tetratricopeptide repeat protein [Verrucomicrobiota bacterium]
MTTGHEKRRSAHYTLSWLPWVLGAFVAGGYLLTTHRHLSLLPDWTSVQQIPAGVRALGWGYTPEVLAPVYYLVTLPLRWLPATWIPLALNLFSAGCAALALGQLARSVALLPHDRTASQKLRLGRGREFLTHLPLAWLPPVLATVVCALNLTFWEYGTNGSGEMLDLLLFAYVLRCFLEYRRDEQPRRLFRSALVYGLALTNNPAMIAFFPIYLGALVWTRKLEFFRLDFLGRMLLCGLIGLAAYLVLPTIGAWSADTSATFWELLRSNLGTQRWVLTTIPREALLLLSLTSLVPVFLLAIRWSPHSDASRVGSAITNVAFHVCHAALLLACLWVMLDPGFSPRAIRDRLPFPGGYFTFLPLYYLAALSIGYYSGYLLVVSQAAEPGRPKRPAPGALQIQWGVAAGLLALLVGTPLILLDRNLPQIRLTNGPLQNRFAAAEAYHLPERGIILSDDPRRLWIVQEWLMRQKRAADYTFVVTGWLMSPDYQKFLQRHHADWIVPDHLEPKTAIPDYKLLRAMTQMATNHQIAYLHPSFGYYFEAFVAEPNGLGSLLLLNRTGALLDPPLAPDCVTRNNRFWSEAETGLLATLLPVTRPTTRPQALEFPDNFYKKIGLKPQRNQPAEILGAYCSRSLVRWGVELQKLNDYPGAAKWFALAEELNPDNVVASGNLQFNEQHQRGDEPTLAVPKGFADIFGETRTWEQMLSVFGPYDLPGLALQQGMVFMQGNLPRQAAQYFDRTRVLVPDDISSRSWLAQLNLNRGQPDATLKMVEEIRQIGSRLPHVQTNLTDLFCIEAAAYLAKQDDATADRIINENLARAPRNYNLLAAACKVYADNHRYTNALALSEQLLQLSPTNMVWLINRGCFLLELSDYAGAVQAFDRALTVETNNYRTILYRAIAQLHANRLEDAQKDYETVQRQFPKEYAVDYGLGEIAFRRNDTNAAIRHYENYLLNAPAQTAEAQAVVRRLRSLKGESGPPAGSPTRPPSKS